MPDKIKALEQEPVLVGGRPMTAERFSGWLDLEFKYAQSIQSYQREFQTELPRSFIFNIVLRDLRRDINAWRVVYQDEYIANVRRL